MTDEELSRLLDDFERAVRWHEENRLRKDSHGTRIAAENYAETSAAILAYFERRKAGEGVEDAERLSARITEYLSAGGLWNPECMDHDKVRRLLIDCRTEFDAAIADSAIKAAIAQVDAARTEGE